MTARTEKVEQAYQEAKLNGDLKPINKETPLREWEHWILVENRFPHDRIVDLHHLLVYKSEVPVNYIPVKALSELWYDILPWADTQYDFVKLNMSNLRSVQTIPHLHLCIYKDTFK